MDHHIPAPVTRGLRRRGVDVLTAAEDGSQRLADADLLTRATELGRVLVSMDRHLPQEVARRGERACYHKIEWHSNPRRQRDGCGGRRCYRCAGRRRSGGTSGRV
ncbi:MAG: DUF5615 family PIN-like protein [Tepidisphaeraceae bacterium]